ncbi:MAG: signal peptidase I [Eubacteriales bacterium]
MKKASKIFDKILSAIALLIVLAAAVIVAGPRIIGWQPFEVLSGSMEPTYPVGSVIYVSKADPQSVKVNDPITFYLSDNTTVVTHRVIKIDADNQLFYTKGDANKDADAGPTPYSRLIGKPQFFIPGMGFFTSYVNTPRGRIITTTALVCLIIIAFLPGLLMKIGRKESDTQADNRSKEG